MQNDKSNPIFNLVLCDFANCFYYFFLQNSWFLLVNIVGITQIGKIYRIFCDFELEINRKVTFYFLTEESTELE